MRLKSERSMSTIVTRICLIRKTLEKLESSGKIIPSGWKFETNAVNTTQVPGFDLLPDDYRTFLNEVGELSMARIDYVYLLVSIPVEWTKDLGFGDSNGTTATDISLDLGEMAESCLGGMGPDGSNHLLVAGAPCDYNYVYLVRRGDSFSYHGQSHENLLDFLDEYLSEDEVSEFLKDLESCRH